jgi:hypothetical protein
MDAGSMLGEMKLHLSSHSCVSRERPGYFPAAVLRLPRAGFGTSCMDVRPPSSCAIKRSTSINRRRRIAMASRIVDWDVMAGKTISDLSVSNAL